jgi:hypothetical protein
LPGASALDRQRRRQLRHFVDWNRFSYGPLRWPVRWYWPAQLSRLSQGTIFRWDFLSRRILALGNFTFYPPLQLGDFRSYFYPDGIPPLVSFAHWWLYAATGKYLPVITCLWVAAQFASTLAFTYGTAAVLFSRRTGLIAAALLAACPLFCDSVVMGQETGLTAMSVAATVYFLVSARKNELDAEIVAAGLAAAVCALSREYGWIAVAGGLVTLIWQRRPIRQMAIFAITSIAAAGPWYVRNWGVTGNPFYSLKFFGFAVNPVHGAICASTRQSLVWGLGMATIGSVRCNSSSCLRDLPSRQVLWGR